MAAYEKQTWANGVGGATPITAARLAHMEDGIENPVESIPPGTFVQAGRVFLSATGSDANAGDVPGSPLLTLPAAITAAGGDYTRVTISGAVAVAATVTVPHNVTLDFEYGSQLVPATGATVTINGAIYSPRLQHIFDVTDGDVVFGPSSWVQAVFPRWFGATGQRADNQTSAIVKTFASIQQIEGITELEPTYSGPSVHIPYGCYKVDADTLLIDNLIHFKVTGDGSRAHSDYARPSTSILITGAGTEFGMKVSTNKARDFSMDGVAIEYDSADFTGDLFVADATGGSLNLCSFSYDSDSEVPGSGVRFTANSAIRLVNKEWTVDKCFTTGSQYGVILEETANTTKVLNSVLADHVITGLKTATGASPIQNLLIQGNYFNVVDLDGTPASLPRPLHAIDINANGYLISGNWFSGATEPARWTGSALLLQGTGAVTGNNVTATTGPGVEITGTGSVATVEGNWIHGDPPLILRGGGLLESGNDYTVNPGGVSTTHVDINPDNSVVWFRCGPSRFRSTVTNSYRAHATGTNQQGAIFTQSVRNGATVGVSAPAAITIISLGTGNTKLAGQVELAGGIHEGLNSGNTTASTTINLANGNVHDRTLAVATTTFIFSGAVAAKGSSFTLVLRQDGAGGRAVVWPVVLWPNGSAPTLSATAGAIDVLTFITTDGGTTWLGFLGGVALAVAA